MPVIEAVPTKNSRRATINKFKLNVQTNAACVDILVWAAREETGEAKNFFMLFRAEMIKMRDEFVVCTPLMKSESVELGCQRFYIFRRR